jgi:signal transduction histidine kinase
MRVTRARLDKRAPGVPEWPQPSSLNCVISTDELTRRPARAPDLATETRVLLRLADTMANAPGQLLQELVGHVHELCHAGSTGISLLEPPSAEEPACFRWIATAGRFQQYAGHTMPRSSSPCGAVIDADEMMLMSHPSRHFPDIEALSEPVEEVLLLPFHRDNAVVGTIWVVSHCEQRRFDQEDVRLIRDLAHFAAAAVSACADAQANARLEADARVAAERQLTELAEINRRILTADRGKSQSLATLGHELRNAIGPLSNAVTVLQNASDPQVLRRAGQIMDRQMSHLSRLIEDVLESSRISSGKLRLETTAVNLNSIVSQAVELASERIAQSGQTVELALCPDALIVDGDSQRLSQVLTNLLNNAAKYGRSGCPVTVQSSQLGDWAVVSVADQGIGIDARMLPRIFDLFVQTDRSICRSQGGLGIGLSLVKQLTELHGGRVEARSDGPGTGSQFLLYLPLHANEAGPHG